MQLVYIHIQCKPFYICWNISGWRNFTDKTWGNKTKTCGKIPLAWLQTSELQNDKMTSDENGNGNIHIVSYHDMRQDIVTDF